MSGRCGEPKPKTTKPSNPSLRRKLRGRPSWKQEAGGCVVPVTRNSERRKETQEAEYRNRKEGMETGRTEEESDRDERNGRAPKEPPTGENGKKGKEETEG